MAGDAMQMESYYARRAPEYDRVYLKPERQPDLRAIEAWLPPLFANASVLEVACGTGYWTRFIAAAADRIVGIDASAETLALARSRVSAAKATFAVGDAYRLPASLGRFGAAFAGFWFSHIAKARRREFLAGLAARLAPGAKVVLLDNRFVAGSSTPIDEADADGNTYQLRRLEDGSRHRVLKNFPSEAELRESIAGFGERPVLTTWQHYWAFQYDAVSTSGR